MTQTYVSLDIETDGQVPGLFSMRSIGLVVYGPELTEIGQHTVNILPLPGATVCPETARWWRRFPDQWAALQIGATDPTEATRGVIDWLKSLSGEVVLAADPAAWDGMFVNWYIGSLGGIKSFDELPWKHRVLDIRTLASQALGCHYHEAHGSRVDKAFGLESMKSAGLVPHIALDDARAQGRRLVAILNALRELESDGS